MRVTLPSGKNLELDTMVTFVESSPGVIGSPLAGVTVSGNGPVYTGEDAAALRRYLKACPSLDELVAMSQAGSVQ